ncbi:MAG TPA: hypothetical protein VNW15_04325 [Rhizomicrobium sp.]|nr:hypothetical protein [Rhizomicrobium sp.]
MTLRKPATLVALLLLGTSPLYAQGGGTPEARAARAAEAQKQLALEASLPKLEFTEQVLPLRIPDHTLGETEGVSMNAAGHLFVYSRTGKGGSARGGTAAELYEFGPAPDYKFVKQWLPDQYGASFAHSVRVDKDQNVWIVDEGSGMVIESKPNGDLVKELGRKPEAIDYLESYLERGEKVTERHPVGTMGTFNRPTDIAWAPNGDFFVSDGYGNSRAVKIAKDGTWLKAVGTYGSGPQQFNTPHGIEVSNDGIVYVTDRANNRVQAFTLEGKFLKEGFIKRESQGTGTAFGVGLSADPAQRFLYIADGSNERIAILDRTSLEEIGHIGGPGRKAGEFFHLHSLDVDPQGNIVTGESQGYRVQKFIFKGLSTAAR